MRGISDYITKDGVRVLRVHYSADDSKDTDEPRGRDWMSKALVGYPGGRTGAKWRREMEIDFNAQGGQLVFPHMEQHKQRIQIANWNTVPDEWVQSYEDALYGLSDINKSRAIDAIMQAAFNPATTQGAAAAPFQWGNTMKALTGSNEWATPYGKFPSYDLINY